MSEVSFSRTPDKGFLELANSEFFVSRGRGIGMERHFPFVNAESPEVEYAYLKEDGTLLAGLVMKDCSANMVVADCHAMAIGLVCVQPGRRGQGYGRHILEASIEHLKELGVDAITLWTSKWRVYESVGFALEDDSLYGWARRSSDMPIPTEGLGAPPAILRDVSVGIPPFGLDVYELSTPKASVSLVIDPMGPIVASWKGEDEPIAHLISAVFPESWRINTRLGDSLVETLVGRGWTFDLKPVKLQMWLSLDSRHDVRYFREHSGFSILDRI